MTLVSFTHTTCLFKLYKKYIFLKTLGYNQKKPINLHTYTGSIEKVNVKKKSLKFWQILPTPSVPRIFLLWIWNRQKAVVFYKRTSKLIVKTLKKKKIWKKFQIFFIPDPFNEILNIFIKLSWKKYLVYKKSAFIYLIIIFLVKFHNTCIYFVCSDRKSVV